MKILFVQTNYPGFLSSFYEDLKRKSSKDINKISYKNIKKYWANEFFGSADFYLKNLKPLGWSGDEIILNDWTMQSKWMIEQNLKLPNKNSEFINKIPARITNFFGFNNWMKKIFFEQLKYYKPDVVYIHDMTFFNLTDLKIIKKFTKLIVGQIAYPLPLNTDLLKGYDLIISSFPHYVEMFKNMGIDSEYLKWCVEESILNTVKGKNKKYNATYVGGLTPHHSNGNKILEKVAKSIDIDFWGYGENLLMPTSTIKKKFHGQAWGKKMYEIFADSKIVINRHINISGKYANNMRMFDATAMGALLLTDQKDNMNEFFNVGSEVVVYKNSDDLVKKAKFYLQHDKERKKIAKAGQKRTLKEHTYKIRMKELNSILLKYLKP